MDHLKIGTPDDKEGIVELLKNFHKASPYSGRLPISYSKIEALVDRILKTPNEQSIALLSMNKSKPVGVLLATVEPNIFHEGSTALELIWWVNEKYRKSSRGMDLIKAYLFWAKKLNCNMVHMACLHGMKEKQLDKLYRSLGFTPTEHAYNMYI